MAAAFQARALVEPHLAEYLLQGYSGVQATLEQVIGRGTEDGSVAAGTDPETAATTLFALTDGLRAQTLLRHGTRERALAVLDAQLDRLFTG